MQSTYIGRFAPSPSGPLHKGSLLAALASFLDARSQGGRWLLRMDDVDHERCRPIWITDIQRCLVRFGLIWDDVMIIQHQRTERYLGILQQLAENGYLYGCSCSKAQLLGHPFYPGFCRNAGLTLDTTCHWRLRTDQNLPVYPPHTSGDFIVRRRNGDIAYHLATVVDDHDCGVNWVVRGADLWSETSAQNYLYRSLHWPQPDYVHIPLLLDARGKKLSKQNHAPALPKTHTSRILTELMPLLGITPEPHWSQLEPSSLLTLAIPHWNRQHIPDTFPALC